MKTFKTKKDMLEAIADMSHDDMVNLLIANGFKVTATKFGYIAQKGTRTYKRKTVNELLLTTKTLDYEV